MDIRFSSTPPTDALTLTVTLEFSGVLTPAEREQVRRNVLAALSERVGGPNVRGADPDTLSPRGTESYTVRVAVEVAP